MKLYAIGIYMKKKTIFKTIVNLSAYSYVYLFVPAYLWRAGPIWRDFLLMI